jgi:hypothetical protein
MVDQLRTGTPPWRPWYEKAKGKDNKVLESVCIESKENLKKVYRAQK